MSAKSSQSGRAISPREESQMATGMDQPFPRLKNAQCEEVSRDYKSGASFQGSVQDNKKTGWGTFIWPNGAKYSGEFVENDRHGKGVQEWPDGSKYSGEFNKDRRHGQGEHTWSNGECYGGDFHHDRRHGQGEYRWPDNSSYTGTFHMDQKEGYAKFTFPDGNVFEGLYRQDEREGPGVVHYPDGREDVGLWRRENLIKLCSDVSCAFTMRDHPEYEYNPDDHKMYITVDEPQNRHDVIDRIVNPSPEFRYEPEVDIGGRTGEIFSDGLHGASLAVDVERYNNTEEFERSKSTLSEKEAAGPSGGAGGGQGLKVLEQQELARSKSKSPASAPARPGRHETTFDVNAAGEYLAWNNTPSSVRMQQHVIRHHRAGGKAVGFDVDKVLKGDRAGFGEKGEAEAASEMFIQAAADGDVTACYDMINQGMVYVDVSDKNGHTALLAAATNWHQDVINCLLDSGANVNKLNDEGVSALAACHVFYYPIDAFRYNIAETYLETPPDFEREPIYDVKEALKGILTAAAPSGGGPGGGGGAGAGGGGGGKGKPSPESKKAIDNLENMKIQRLREEYSGVNEMPSVEQPECRVGGGGGGAEHAGKTLGTLSVKRAVKINVDDVMAYDPEDEALMAVELASNAVSDGEDDFSELSSRVSEGFASERSMKNYRTEVSNQLIERGATALSANEMVVGRSRSVASHVGSLGTVRRLAIAKSEHQLMESTIGLLLKRGADPNAAAVPMPVLYFAVKAADVSAVKQLLEKGASTSARLFSDRGGLYPLHIAAALPGEEGVQITELLLNSLADPDGRADQDKSFLNTNLEEEWSKDVIDPSQQEILGGRTPLHIACARDDNYKNACRVVHLLLDHHANTNLLCNGHSPLALAIISGNDLAIDELLVYGVDPCLPLTHGVGSALCVASTTEYEHRRNPDGRIKLIDKLVKAGADILALIPIGPKRLIGSAVDYAYYMYNLDRRIAHMPYHALTHAERETFNARRRLLAHLGDILRVKAVEAERRRIHEEQADGKRSRSPSPNFVYTKAGASLPPGIIRTRAGRGYPLQDSRVSFGRNSRQDDNEVRRPLFRYCYECGRSVFVRLAACTRCKEVYYCSKACKLKAWNARHKEECIRIAGTGRSPSPNNKDKRVDSPTPATDPDKGKPTTVHGIAANSRIKLPELHDTAPNLFMTGGYDPDNPEHVLDPSHPHGGDRNGYDNRGVYGHGHRGGGRGHGGPAGRHGRGGQKGGNQWQPAPPGSKGWGGGGAGGRGGPGHRGGKHGPPGSKHRGPPGSRPWQQHGPGGVPTGVDGAQHPEDYYDGVNGYYTHEGTFVFPKWVYLRPLVPVQIWVPWFGRSKSAGKKEPPKYKENYSYV